MANPITVRPATMADYDAICRLIQQVDRHHADLLPQAFQPFEGPARPKEAVAACVDAPDADYLLAEQDGEVVGFLNLKVAAYPAHPMFRPHGYVLIENLVVDEAHRRRGVGRALFEAAREWVEARGLRHIELTVWVANEPALAFYRRQGFRTLTHRMGMELPDVGNQKADSPR